MKAKLIILLFLSSTFLMCKNDKPSNNSKTETKIEVKTVSTHNETSNDSFLKAKKSADYSSLFTKDNDICLTVDDIAKATGLVETSISKKKGYDDTYCEYEIKLPNGKKMNYGFGVMVWTKEQVKKEINSYKRKKQRNEVMFGMEIELSETGDTYFTHQPLHGRVLIVNPNYDLIIGTKYSKVGFNLEEKKEAQKYAVKIANYLLHKHKK